MFGIKNLKAKVKELEALSSLLMSKISFQIHEEKMNGQIAKLESETTYLKKEVADLKTPFKFNIGDKVSYSTKSYREHSEDYMLEQNEGVILGRDHRGMIGPGKKIMNYNEYSISSKLVIVSGILESDIAPIQPPPLKKKVVKKAVISTKKKRK